MGALSLSLLACASQESPLLIETDRDHLPSGRTLELLKGGLPLAGVRLAQGAVTGPQLTTLREELERCGVGLRGSGCLESALEARAPLYRGEGALTRISVDLSLRGGAPLFRLVFRISGPEGQPCLEEGLVETPSAQPLLHLVPLEAPVTQLLARLEKRGDLRQAYHDGVYLARAHPGSEEPLRLVLWPHLLLALESDDTSYQRGFLALLEEHLSSPQILGEFASGLMRRAHPQLALRAAVALGEQEDLSAEVRLKVGQALEHPDWRVRLRALAILARLRLEVEEELALLERLADRDGDVRHLAVQLSARLLITPAHQPLLERLSQHHSWTTRRPAIALLTRLAGRKVTEVLLGFLHDADMDVRETAQAALHERPLDESFLPLLRQALSDERWTVQLSAVRLLGRTSGSAATAALAGQLSHEVREVHQAVVEELTRRLLAASDLPALQPHLSAQHWLVRREATALVGRVAGTEASALLVERLGDGDQDVRRVAFQALSTRPLGEAEVHLLQAQQRLRSWRSRLLAVQLLGQVEVESATTALREALNDSDQEVRRTADALLQQRRGCP